ncbi:SPOR domain-containing protein [Georgenia sp. EYE_87]|jgi:hypothetical protein|uniref:SPOR domain-containing protein n=1 Tax=Georgenia sp. EYE_87 TaxID=2853448 RepID=UPI002003C2BA|nr:SPOR domain-containing protein [Georgenia sp. EYE_87]MCK6209371.1 SPOR domain-containing protein [Georgenia sp. EYE_87]
MTAEPREFYYNLSTGEVEEGKVHGATNRMGPYPSAEEAAQALARAEARNEKWAEEDEAWEDEQ